LYYSFKDVKVLNRVKVLYVIDLLTESFVLSTLIPFDIDKEGDVIEWIKVKVSNDEVTKIKITIQTPKPSEMSTSKS
tara:strand:+ start:12139 stop:12369 length:231 start_codon:yes stop_codon:yes gene_type:complete